MKFKISGLFFFFLILLPHPGFLAEINSTILGQKVMQFAQGIGGINLSSGDDTAQGNVWSLGIGTNGNIWIKQRLCNQIKAPNISINVINGFVLSQALGIFAINQASGSNVAEANLVTFSLGVAVKRVGTSYLAQSVAQPLASRRISSPGNLRLDFLGEKALQGARGIFQINQSAGSVNALANSFSLNLLGASSPGK